MASAQDQKFKVNVKWSKELLKDVELDTSESPQVFKMQLWTLTGVPPERQTVLGLRGGKLKDDADWSKTGIKPNMTLMLMGTPGDSLKAPPAKLPKVRDDLNATAEDEMNFDAAPSHPPGLVNMGNTCYMNATVQCLNTVQPLRDALQQYRGSTTALNPDEKLSASLRDLVSRMGSGNASKIDPTSFLTTLRQVNPQFAERGRNHFYMQQDAEECWGEILSRLAAALKPAELKTDSGESEAASSNSSEASNRIDELFGIEIISTDKCEEDETEQPIERKESIRVLKCHISLAVNHLSQGIAEGLEDVIEKNSDNLGRTAKWKRTSRLNKIPPFLIVQFVRFFWKPTEGVKAKILRNVSFPVQLDLYDFCTEELKQKLSEKRSLQAPVPEEDKGRPEPSASSSAAGTSETVVEASASIGAPSKDSSASTPVQAEAGNYELCAVLTHKGRAADAGHYVAWVKDSGSRWYKFDDDKVFVQTEDDVKKLSGGGDWHMAYMCVYRAKNTF